MNSNQSKSFLKTILELGKVRISLPIALSALTGYVLYSGKIDGQGWLLTLGVFLMAVSSSMFNHWQERNTDAKMTRTKNRPIPSGRISAGNTFTIASIVSVAGSIILILTNPPIALVLSWATLIFYNIVYTPLKKVTAFAVIPGSMVGALPPLIGWTGAGGSLYTDAILLVATFFFIGQIPHFWLLLLLFGNQYETAGMPSLNQIFSEIQIKRITFIWILTTIASALLVILFVFSSILIKLILLLYSIYLLFNLSIVMLGGSDFKARPTFYKLNFLYLFMMIFLITDALIRN